MRSSTRILARRLALGVSTGMLLAPAVAGANGRFPFANQLVVDPSTPAHMVVRSTYGLLQSFDRGNTWRWACEQAVGYTGTFDPAIGVSSSGAIVAGTFEGLSRSPDLGCSWSFDTGVLAHQFVIDLVVDRRQPSRVVAMTSTGIPAGGINVVFAESLDGGATWTQLGTARPRDYSSETLEIAPSNPDRIYSSGVVAFPRQGAFERSNDRGKTWTRSRDLIDLGKAKAVFLAGVDATNPDMVYARLDGAPYSLLLSTDGTATWKEIFKGKDNLLGFALSPDGKRVAVGGPRDGIWVAARDEWKFAQTSKVGARCLTWTPAGLYACGSEFPDTFTVGVSSDEGRTFNALYHLSDLSQLDCPRGSLTEKTCTPQWPSIQVTIGQTPDAGPAGVRDAAADGSADTSGTPVSLPPSPSGERSGCSCSASGGGDFGATWLAAVVGGALLVVRRRGARDRRVRAQEGATLAASCQCRRRSPR